jgi:hypothetical protein
VPPGADATMPRHLLNGCERRVWGKKAYVGLCQVIKEVATKA